MQPIFVGDIAALLVDAAERTDDYAMDAVGPEAYSFNDLVGLIAAKIGRPAHIAHVPAPLAYTATKMMGWFLGDTVLTWEEYRGLMDDLLVSRDIPAANALVRESLRAPATSLSAWLAENRETVGLEYASEVARHF